jgi:hypothetical protein
MGALFGLTCGALAFMAAGFGHGTYIPAALMFGPPILGLSFAPHAPDWIFYSIPGLYVTYAFLLAVTNWHRATRWSIGAVHYTCAITYIFRNEFELKRIARTWEFSPALLIGCVAGLIVVNVMAFVSRRSR